MLTCLGPRASPLMGLPYDILQLTECYPIIEQEKDNSFKALASCMIQSDLSISLLNFRT